MAQVVIYTRDWCPYCFRAKSLLDARGAAYEEIDLEQHPDREDEMTRRAGGNVKVPQIFIDGEHVGDSDELGRLESSGRLDALLGETPQER